MNKTIWIVIGLVVVGGIGYFALRKPSTNSATSGSVSPVPSSTSSTAPAATPTPAPSTPSSAVSIQDMAFTPSAITVKKGTKVTWTNNDAITHTVTESDSQTGPAGTVSPGSSYSFTFNTVGTFKYHCTIHPTMTGTVTVTE